MHVHFLATLKPYKEVNFMKCKRRPNRRRRQARRSQGNYCARSALILFQSCIMSVLCPVAVPLEALNEPQAKTSSEAFLSFLKKKRLCDVTFVLENQPDKIQAHQFCLRARSPVFDSMFQGLGCGTDMKEVQIDDASPETVNKFLEFIYADKFDVTVAPQALHLLHLGLKYKVQPLVDKCEAFLAEGISSEHAIEIYEAAEKYQLMDLRDEAGVIIASSFEDFLQDPMLMKAKDTTLIALLKRGDLNVKEADLFKLALQWGQNNSSGDHELAEALTDMLPHIRFTDMTPEEFTTVVWPTKLIPLEDAANIYAYITGDESTKAEILPLLNSESSGPGVQIEPEILFQFNQFFYADKFDVTTAQALHLLDLGHENKVQALVNRCEAFIGERLTIENAIKMYEVAKQYKLTDLRTKAGHVIARSFEHFLKDPELMKAEGTTLISLLKRNDLTVPETDLFQLALQWGQANSNGDHRLAVTLAGSLLPFIRFTNMTPQEFTNVVWPMNLLPGEDIIKIYAYMNGDNSTRNAISPLLKYETSRRNVKVESKFQSIMTFVSDQNWLLAALRKAEGCIPFKEFISFNTAVIGLWEEWKKFRIPTVIVRWPIQRLYHGGFHYFLSLAILLLLLLTVVG